MGNNKGCNMGVVGGFNGQLQPGLKGNTRCSVRGQWAMTIWLDQGRMGPCIWGHP